MCRSRALRNWRPRRIADRILEPHTRPRSRSMCSAARRTANAAQSTPSTARRAAARSTSASGVNKIGRSGALCATAVSAVGPSNTTDTAVAHGTGAAARANKPASRPSAATPRPAPRPLSTPLRRARPGSPAERRTRIPTAAHSSITSHTRSVHRARPPPFRSGT